MVDAPVTIIPPWAQAVIAIGTPLGAVFAYVTGRASKTGASDLTVKNLSEEVHSMKGTLNDTVITVSNHGQSLRYVDGRISDLEAKINTANTGIATLLERTKKL